MPYGRIWPNSALSPTGQLVSMSDRAVIEHLYGLALEPVHGGGAEVSLGRLAPRVGGAGRGDPGGRSRWRPAGRSNPCGRRRPAEATAGSTDRRSRRSSRARLRLLLPRRALLDRAQALRPVPSRTNSAMVLGE